MEPRAHMDAYLDFWCGQLEHRIAYFTRKDEQKRISDEQKDQEDERSGFAR